MTNSNDKYAEWLKHKIDYYGRYHDHKETMAWLATAFYLAGVLYLAFASRSHHFCLSGQGCITAFFVGATLAFGFFVDWQFHKRWKAYIYVEGLNLAMKRILPTTRPLTKSEREFRRLESQCRGGEWPSFVATEIEGVLEKEGKQRKWTRFLGVEYFKSDAPEPVRSESVTYLAIILAFLAAILLVWWT